MAIKLYGASGLSFSDLAKWIQRSEKTHFSRFNGILILRWWENVNPDAALHFITDEALNVNVIAVAVNATCILYISR